MRAGKALRDKWALDRAYEKPCAKCGHPLGHHRELPYETYSFEDGAVVVTRNPDYVALHFHCSDCDCVVEGEGR